MSSYEVTTRLDRRLSRMKAHTVSAGRRSGDMGKRRSQQRRQAPQWRWHLDKVFVKINREIHYLWRAVHYAGEVLEAHLTKTRDKASALKCLKKAIRPTAGAASVAGQPAS